MATATFTFTPDPSTVGLLDHFVITTSDSGGNVVNTQTLPATATTASVTGLSVGAPYKTVLQSCNAANVADSNPPFQNYVVPQPPPSVPGDPSLNPPTFS